MSDYKSLFKTAKSQRQGAAPTKLSKEQIRALKAQKAAAAAQEAKEAAYRREREEAARAAASAAPPQKQMPPLAPRPGNAVKAVPPPPKFGDPKPPPPMFSEPVPFRAESQATVIVSSSGDTPSSDGSIKGPAARDATAASLETQRSTAGTNGSALPAGFFEEASSVEASTSQSGLPSGFFEAPRADEEDDEGPAASGVPNKAMGGPLPSAAGTVEGSLPAGFFEEAEPEKAEAEAPAAAGASMRTAAASTSDQNESSSAIPKGFFQDAEADAKARGEKPAKPRTKEETFSEFMTSIAADVREVQQREEEEAADEAKEKEERQLFEQQMRLKRIEQLKSGGASSGAEPTAAEPLGFDEVALDVSSITEAPVQPRKRRRLTVLESDPENVEDAEEGEDDDDLMLDWRAKKV